MAAARDLAGFFNSSQNVSALDRHYRRTMGRILKELAGGVSQPGAARARDLIARIRKLTNELDPAKDSFVRKWIRREIPKAFVLGDKAATRQLREQLETVSGPTQQEFGQISRSFTGANKASMRAVVAAMEDQLGRAASDVFATAKLTVRRTQLKFNQDQAIREATVGGIIRGGTGKQLSDDIARILLNGNTDKAGLKNLRENGFGGSDIQLFRELSEGKFITVGKKTFSVRTYANLVARTQGSEAHKVANVVRLQQNGVNHVKISRHNQVEPDECTPFAGKVFYVGPLSKDPAGFPSLKSILNAGPPFHPQCRHVTEPFVVEFETAAAIEKAKDSANAIPKRIFGQKSNDIRKLVTAASAKDLESFFEEGAEDLRRGAA